jgi:hypothetical protein
MIRTRAIKSSGWRFHPADNEQHVIIPASFSSALEFWQVDGHFEVLEGPLYSLNEKQEGRALFP